MSWNGLGDHRLIDQNQLSPQSNPRFWRKTLLQIGMTSPQILAKDFSASQKKLLSHFGSNHLGDIPSKKFVEFPKTEGHHSSQSIPTKMRQPNKETEEDSFNCDILQDLIQLLPQGIALVNSSQEIIYNNAQILDLLQCDRHDVLKTITGLSTRLNYSKTAAMQAIQNSPNTQFNNSPYLASKPNTLMNVSGIQQSHQLFSNKSKNNNNTQYQFASKRLESSFDNILNSPFLGEENSSPRQQHNSSFHNKRGIQASLFSSGQLHSPGKAPQKSGSSDSRQKQNLQDFLLDTLGNEELRIKATLSPHMQKNHIQETLASPRELTLRGLAAESRNDTEDENNKKEKMTQEQQQQCPFGSTKNTQKQDLPNDSFSKQHHLDKSDKTDKTKFLSFSVDLNKQQETEQKSKAKKDEDYDPHKSTTQLHRTQKDSFDCSQSMKIARFHRSFSNQSLPFLRQQQQQKQQKNNEIVKQEDNQNQSFSREPSQIQLFKQEEGDNNNNNPETDLNGIPENYMQSILMAERRLQQTKMSSRQTRNSENCVISQRESNQHLLKKELNHQMSLFQPQIKQMNVKVGHLLSSMLEFPTEGQNNSNTNNNLNTNTNAGGIKKSSSKNVAFSQISEVFETSYSRNQSLFGQINGNSSIGFYQCKDNIAQIQVTCKGKPLSVLLMPCENPSEPQQSFVLIIVQSLWEDLIKARLEESNKKRLKLFGSLCHELRTPLNCAISFLDLFKQLKEGGEDQAMIEEYIDPSLRSNQFMLNTVNDILDFVQMSENKFKFSPMKFNLHKLLQECQSLMSIQAKTKEISLNLVIQQKVPIFIVSDSNRIRQIILNFLSNSMKFTPKGGYITIEANTVDVQQSLEGNSSGIIKVSVKDSGIGIAKSALRRIFEIFNKTSYEDASINPNGCGIGLPLSNSLAKLVGPQGFSPDTQKRKSSTPGGIQVESEQDKGSIFSFCIQDLTQRILPEKHESCEIVTDNQPQQEQSSTEKKNKPKDGGDPLSRRKFQEMEHYKIDISDNDIHSQNKVLEGEITRDGEELREGEKDLKEKILEFESPKKSGKVQDPLKSQTNTYLISLNNSNLNTIVSSNNNNEGAASIEINNNNNAMFTFNNTSLISNGTNNMPKMDVIEDQAGGLSIYHFEPASQQINYGDNNNNNRVKTAFSSSQQASGSHSLIKPQNNPKSHGQDPFGLENLFPIKSQQNPILTGQNSLTTSGSLVKAKTSLNDAIPSKIMKKKNYELNKHGELTKVLIVDDSPFNLLVLKKILELFHIKAIDQCHDGGEVVDKIQQVLANKEGIYDIIFMDIDLPILNGYQACKEIKEMISAEEDVTMEVPIVACSAFGPSIKDENEFYASQLDDAISKPIKQDELQGILEKYLRTPEYK